jgi:hypothetical protein
MLTGPLLPTAINALAPQTRRASYSVEAVPPDLASEAQRDYLRAFADCRWNDPTLTKDQAHDLIDQFVAKDAPTNWTFRDSRPANEAQFKKYHYFGGKLKHEFSQLTQGEMGRLIDRVRPRDGQAAPNPVSPGQAMVLRFFFESAVTNRFMGMTKNDVMLLLQAFYEENPGVRKVWDSWKRQHGIPEHTYLVTPNRIQQNTYATLGQPPLSLNCLNTFKTQKQLDAEWEQQRQLRERQADIRHREAIHFAKNLPSVDLSNIPYKTWSAAATTFKAKYKKYNLDVYRDGSDRHNKQLTIELFGHSSEDEGDDHGLLIDVLFMLPGYVNGGWDCELSITVSNEKTLEYKCWQFRAETEYNTLKKVPRSLPFPSNAHALEGKLYEDLLHLLLNAAPAEPTPPKIAKANPPVNPFQPAVENASAHLSRPEPPELPPADFSILSDKHEAPVKKAWWKFW